MLFVIYGVRLRRFSGLKNRQSWPRANSETKLARAERVCARCSKQEVGPLSSRYYIQSNTTPGLFPDFSAGKPGLFNLTDNGPVFDRIVQRVVEQLRTYVDTP